MKNNNTLLITTLALFVLFLSQAVLAQELPRLSMSLDELLPNQMLQKYVQAEIPVPVEPEPPGGGGANSTENVSIAVAYFNDSVRQPENSTNDFRPGETAFYTLCVYNETDNSTLVGSVLFMRWGEQDEFAIDGCYNGTFTVDNTYPSGWRSVNVVFSNDTVFAAYWNWEEYIVEPVLTEVIVMPISSFGCEQSNYMFAPNDSLYVELLPLDQAYAPIDQELFDYDLFNKTTVSVHDDNGNYIYETEYERLATYEYSCIDPKTGETINLTAKNVADGMVLPDYYSQWFVDVSVNSSYGNLDGYGFVFMPIVPANPSISGGSPINLGQNLTVTFDGWTNARGDVVFPDANWIHVQEFNITYDEWGNQWFESTGTYYVADNVTNNFSFIVQKTNTSTNSETILFLAQLGDFWSGWDIPDSPMNMTDALNLTFSTPTTVTEGDAVPVSLNVRWANGQPYDGLGNLTALLSKPSGSQTVTLQEQGSGTYSVSVTADAVGTWNVSANLTDAYNNTGSAAATLTINAKTTSTTPCCGGGGGGSPPPIKKNVTNTTNKTTAPVQRPTPQPAPTPEPEIQPQPEPEPEPTGPSGMFAAGAGILPVLQSFIAAIVSFFASLFGAV